MKRKICFITGSRAEYGLLRKLMLMMQNSQLVDLQVIATGTHLSKTHGETIQEIIADGIKIDSKVNIEISGDSPLDIINSMGLTTKKLGVVLSELRPDIVVVLGDRWEIFSATPAALILGIPVAHIHGGEVTQGAYDDSLRHAITKLSSLHFVATKQYKKRVIQMGENPKTVFMVGGLGVDAIQKSSLFTKNDLETSLDFRFLEKNLLICYHPETLISVQQNTKNLSNLLRALKAVKHTGLIFTLPNSDTGNTKLTKMILDFVSKNDNAQAYQSLGQLRYFSTLKYIDAILGNSSSGLLEAPSFHIGTINLGDRQKGRLAANSVIHSQPTKKMILESLSIIYSKKFQNSLKNSINPYGAGGSSAKIFKKLLTFPLDTLSSKTFYNIN